MSSRYKVRLSVLVTVPATTELTVEGESINWIKDNLADILDKLESNYEAAYSAYVRNHYAGECPTFPYPSWSVDNEDVTNNVANSEVEVDEWEEIE
jgi:hypothetical protein